MIRPPAYLIAKLLLGLTAKVSGFFLLVGESWKILPLHLGLLLCIGAA
jgi:hypothetical protein